MDSSKKFNNRLTFKEFVEIVSKITDKKEEQHIRSQHTFIIKKNKRLVEYVGKFENLEEEMDLIKRMLKIPKKFKLPKLNGNEDYNYLAFYDKETLRLVSKRYENDFIIFDYKKGL